MSKENFGNLFPYHDVKMETFDFHIAEYRENFLRFSFSKFIPLILNFMRLFIYLNLLYTRADQTA